MTRARIALAVTAAACVLAAGAGPARAYVRYRTQAGQPFVWPRTCLGFIVYPAALANMLPADQVVAASAAAADAWSRGQVAGTALDIQVAAADGAAPAVAYDGQSSLAFRTDRWCKATDAPGVCSYDPAALALTTIFARNSTGEMLDADIEVNAKSFLWSDLELGTQASAGLHDLQNALTHEVGHFIGLEHPCLLPGTDPSVERPLDNLGNPAPDCDAASPAILESTMFPSATSGDLSKRTLAPDDELAAREIYPASAGAPAVCAPPQPKSDDPSDGCAVGGAAAAPAPGALALLAAALAWRAARRRRSAR